VITEKSKNVFEKVKAENIREICEAIAEKPENLIVVHGAGSFGHPYVEKYDLKNKKDPLGVSATHLACLRLNEIFSRQLAELGVAVAPISPFNFFKKTPELECDVDFISSVVKEGFVPVLHGDMIYNCETRKFEVLSGDEIVVFLAERLEVDRVGFATDVEGIMYHGEILKIFDASMLESIGFAGEKADVTGGMRGKVEKILRMRRCCEVYIFKGNRESVVRFLKGYEVGTRVMV
jgi:isopentenyl phosphate kinase